MEKKPKSKAVAVRKKKTPAVRALSIKQERFYAEYLVDLNATQAAKRAGYSLKTAHAQGHRLLKHVLIAPRLEQARKEWQERVGITQDAVLTELALLGFSRASKFVRETKGGEIVVDLSEATERDMAAIKSIESVTTITSSGDGKDSEETTKTKITLHDKRLPLRDIGQHLGMFKDDSKVQPAFTVQVKEIKIVGVLPDGEIDDSDDILQEV